MKSRLCSVRNLWPVSLSIVMSFLLSCDTASQKRLQAADHYHFAQSYLANQSYALAEQEIRKALLMKSQDAEYLGFLALIYQARGQLDAAEEAYHRALEQADIPPAVPRIRPATQPPLGSKPASRFQTRINTG